MAELTFDPCCASEQQTTCCEPSAKAACCGQEGGGCCCEAGNATAEAEGQLPVLPAQRAAALGRASSTPLRSSTVW